MARQMEFNFKIDKPLVLIKQEQKITSVEKPKQESTFIFKTFEIGSRPSPGDLINEIYRYIEFTKADGDVRTKFSIFQEGLDAIIKKQGHRLHNADISINSFKKMAREVFRKRNQDNS